MKWFLLVIFLFLSLSGCYVLKQGTYLAHYQSRAEKISQLLEREDLEPETRRFLEEVLAIKKYAVNVLGLKDNKNYSRYIATDRTYLVDVVTACKAASFTPKIWKFPVVGEVPYKGFYQKQDAGKLARRLRKDGYDVWIRKVDAFSTLGFFSDPVYSFMQRYPPYYLADLIIHEQTHATIFIKNHVPFNEELATFVGREGALSYIETKADNPEAVKEHIRLVRQDREQFYALMRKLYKDLESIYTSGITEAEKIRRKEEIISAFKRRIRDDYSDFFSTDNYRYIADMDLNNAHIITWNIYTRDLSLYYDVYRSLGNSLPRFLQRVQAVEAYKGDPKVFLRSLLP